MSKRLHNPKSHAPAVYIPCWLIQISSDLLSHAAKIVYGRLSQWANESGIVYRSATQLAEEIGTTVRSLERHLKELRDCGLIGTFQARAGGVNHFEFYDHPWMYEPIKEQLVYKTSSNNPPPQTSEPPAKIVGTPPSKVADLNIKEIKNIKSLKHSVDFDKSPKDDYRENPLFMSFYKIYPNKQKPFVAYKVFSKLKPTADFVEMLIEDVLTRMETTWKGRHKNKIPHPATYLNSREWESETYEAENKKTDVTKTRMTFQSVMEA